MIRIMFGNPGSGKTACMVRELALNPSSRYTFSNIITKHIKSNIVINGSMIVKKTQIGTKKDGTPIFNKELNTEFWKEAIQKYKSINVVIDEAHIILNARRSMMKSNVIMTDFMSMIRRMLGSSASGYGELILISQLERRIDIIAKEMCTQVRFHVCHYRKSCVACGASWQENNETSEPAYSCPACRNIRIVKHDHVIEVWHFRTPDMFVMWKYYGKKTYHMHYYVNDIEQYFPLYNMLQWDSLISEI